MSIAAAWAQRGLLDASGARARRAQLMRRLEETLRRLATDRVEIYLNHAVDDLERLRNPEWLEFVANQEGLPRVMKKAHEKGVGVFAMKTLMGAKDLWVFEFQATPPMVDATLYGITGIGQVFALDEPVWPIEERPIPASDARSS